MRGALPIAALMLTGAASDARDLDKALAGRVPGARAVCVSTSRIDTPMPFGDRTILYRDGGRLWRNDLQAACPGLDDDSIIVTEIDGGQLCRNDHFYTIRRGGGAAIPGPRCRLGSFTAYEKARR